MTGKIKLFGYWRSQAAYRVRIALALKGLEWEETSVDLLAGEQFSGELAEHNPQHAVPLLLDGGPSLSQSLAIIEYLEETHPLPPLYPQAPYARAAARSFALISITDSHPFQVPRVRKDLAARFGASESDTKSWAQHWQTLALQAMEARLVERREQCTYCFGDRPGIADIGLVSHVCGAMTFDTVIEPYANVLKIFERCNQFEAFSAHSPQALKPANID